VESYLQASSRECGEEDSKGGYDNYNELILIVEGMYEQ
jgi:hypothetical protein